MNSPRSNYTILAGTVSIATVSDFLAVLNGIAQGYAVTIQALEATLIAGVGHINSAVQKAIRALEHKRGITSDLGLEILLYASGRRQIERALAMGVTEGEHTVAVVIVDVRGDKDLDAVAEAVKRETGIEEMPLQELEVDPLDEQKKANLKRFFAITDEELKAVGEQKLQMLVLERVALLDVLK
jgi:KEOPS complex subunit Cgi121